MLYITVRADAPLGQAIGIKEDFAMYLEKWGDARVIEIREECPKQMRMEGEQREARY